MQTSIKVWVARLTYLKPAALQKTIMIAPLFILLVIFIGYPIAFSGWITFSTSVFPIGDLAELLARQEVIEAETRTVIFILIKTVLNLILGLGLALTLRQQNLLNRFLRTIILFPAFISILVLSVIVAFVFDAEFGLANLVLKTIGLAPRAWLLDKSTAQIILAGLSVWRDQGLIMYSFLAGIAAIPRDILDAARLDGATQFNLAYDIILPMIKKTTAFATAFCIYLSLQFIAPILEITRGGPSAATTTSPYLIYLEAFVYFDYQGSIALSFFTITLPAIMIGLILILYKIRRR